MNVNNFDDIEDLLEFTSEDDFYFVEVLKRKKENPEMTGYSTSIKMYHIKSIEQLNSLQEEIKTLCKVFNARAYIALNRRSFKQIAYKTLLKTAEQLELGNYSKFSAIYKSCCSSWNKDPNKKWILDFDDEELNIYTVKILSDILYPCRPVGNKIIKILPTVNGFHLVTKPFNTEEADLDCEIHKDRLTVLYYNKENE